MGTSSSLSILKSNRFFLNPKLNISKEMVTLPNQSSLSFETCSSSDDIDADSPQMTLKQHGAVVFITGANESKRFLFEAARRVGLDIVVIDSEESAGRRLESLGVVDRFLPVDLDSEVSKAASQCYSLIRSLDVPVRGVVTFMEMSVLLSSMVAELCGLPGLSPASVSIARDKRLTREATRTAGLASPAAFLIKTASDVAPASAHVGFPAVLKPIIGADSLGVKRVDNLAELLEAFSEASRVMNSAVISAGFLTAVDVTSAVDAPSVLPVEFLLEEYLDGPEVDIDLLLHNGQCFYSAVSDNGQTVEPYFTETYGNLPSVLPARDQAALTQLAVDATSALGLDMGVFHVEAKLTSRGPRLIEINARLGGGPICEMHRRVAGIDLAYEQVRLCVGLGPSFKAPGSHPAKSAFAYMTTNAISSGTVGGCLDFLKRHDCTKMFCRVKPGDKVVGPKEGQPTWLTEIWMEAESPSETSNLVKEICHMSDLVAAEFANSYVH